MKKLKRLITIPAAGLIIGVLAIVTPTMMGTASADGHSTAGCNNGSNESVERNNYFNGMLLAAEDLTSEQSYAEEEKKDVVYLVAEYRLICIDMSELVSLMDANQKANQYVSIGEQR